MRLSHPFWASSHGATDDTIQITPPILNSANPWATDLADLKALYFSPFTGAVTTRTTLIGGFPHNDAIHQYAFFDTQLHTPTQAFGSAQPFQTGSLNTLGYSPLPLSEYLHIVKELSAATRNVQPDLTRISDTTRVKPIIISVTGSPEEVLNCLDEIATTQKDVNIPLMMEINLSCPNIEDKPPPAYSGPRLIQYLTALEDPPVPIGLKVPPYTYADQFKGLIDALSYCANTCKVSFITATNTLGSSLILSAVGESTFAPKPAINSSTGAGIGGLAGAPLHPLALGNVRILHGMLKARPELQHVQIIGVGGVSDAEGYKRMRSVGAAAVAIGTALGRKGVEIFREIGDQTADESEL